MLTKYNLIAETYLEAYRHAQYDDSLMESINKILLEPLEGLKLIEALISKATGDAELAYISAGPLEDLFIEYYEIIFDPLDKLLRTDIKMRKALSGIWVSKNTKAREALDKLLNKYHLKYGSL